MSLTGHRTERIRVELLTKDEESKGFLDGVDGGHLEWNANADLPAGGYLLLEDLNQDINFSQDRIRIWWEVEGVEPWPLGVYVMSVPSVQFRGDGTSREIQLIDKLTILREHIITSPKQVWALANPVTVVLSMLNDIGETNVASTPTATAIPHDMLWPPGTSMQRIINDLLSVAGYWSIWTDRNGQFRIDPYVLPADRAIVWDFKRGDTAIHSPDWEYQTNLWEATNTVVLSSQPDGPTGNVFYASAVDNNPNSPTSTVSLGRPLNAIVEDGIVASSQADLQRMADRKLADNSNVSGKLLVSHAPVPIWYNEAVHFTTSGMNMDTRATVTKMSLELSPGALINAEWRQA